MICIRCLCLPKQNTVPTGDGLPAVAMHGNKSQAQRTKALQKFKRGAARVMVATDVAARGLDIQKLPFVINFELPMVAEDYVHRIGRTGRAGEKGDAISFVCATEHRLMREIQHLLKINVEFEVADGFEPAIQFPVKKQKNKPQPRKLGSRERNNGNASHKQKNQTDKTRNRYRDGMGSEKKTGKQTQARSNQSPSGGDGRLEKQKQWGHDSTSPKAKKRQKPRIGKAKHWSDKSKQSAKHGGSQNQRDGFAPPKRKTGKRAISAR